MRASITGATLQAQLPDAPQPQPEVAAFDPASEQPQPTQQAAQNPTAATEPPTSTSTPAPAGASSSSQAPASETDEEKKKRQEAGEQIKQEEKQRVLGVLPSFNTSYRSDAVSLTAMQKISLAFRSSIDPATFGTAFLVAGLHEALDEDTGFGWGPSGYLRRSGAAYLDTFDGNMIGNGFLPAILHQDPRYFRLGHGTMRHRLLYAVATIAICKHDNTGKWEPNYSNVAGNIAAGALSNLYYPPGNSGIGQTISNGMIVTAEGGFGAVFNEFWPDISRKYLHKDPTNGLDAQARAQDQAQAASKKQAAQPSAPQ
jgi:hypothetical protein